MGILIPELSVRQLRESMDPEVHYPNYGGWKLSSFPSRFFSSVIYGGNDLWVRVTVLSVTLHSQLRGTGRKEDPHYRVSPGTCHHIVSQTSTDIHVPLTLGRVRHERFCPCLWLYGSPFPWQNKTVCMVNTMVVRTRTIFSTSFTLILSWIE